MLNGMRRNTAKVFTTLAVTLGAAAANAALVPFNTDTVPAGELGTLVGSLTDGFTNGVGTLESNVFLNDDGVYTYTLAFSPNVMPISEFNTAFSVANLISDGTEVGFSFSQAAAAGGTGTASDVEILLDPDGTLDYEINGDWFGGGDTVTFHFRSLGAPIEVDYNAINGAAGIAKGLGPDATIIPLPGAAWLMISGFGALLAMRRRS